jgi:hypothetical protein
VSAINWGVEKFGDEAYDLSHLRPFRFDVTPAKDPNRSLTVIASFGFHVFTRKRQPGDPGRYFKGTVNDPRTFCPERFECSKGLPAIIRRASNGRVKASNGNYLIIETLTGVPGVYTIAFKLEKAKSTDDCVRMFVVSAHSRPLEPIEHLKEINFVKLVTCIVDRLPIRPK